MPGPRRFRHPPQQTPFEQRHVWTGLPPEAESVKSCPSQALLARTARGVRGLRRPRLPVVNLRSHRTTSTCTMCANIARLIQGPTGRSQPMCVVRDAWTLRTTHMKRGRLSCHHRSRWRASMGLYLISQAMPSRSRSSSSRYPGSPRYKGAAPASFAFLQLGKYMLSCLGSGTGAGAAAPPPA